MMYNFQQQIKERTGWSDDIVRFLGRGDRYLGPLFRVDEPVTYDSLLALFAVAIVSLNN